MCGSQTLMALISIDMEHKLGEIVTLPDGRKAEVVEATRSKRYSTCYKCIWFASNPICPSVSQKWKCSKQGRTDGKNIIYKEIKED